MNRALESVDILAMVFRSFGICLSSIALLSPVPGRCSAQDSYDALISLQQRYDAKLQSRDYEQAEKIARELVRRAERDFSNQPEIITICLNKLGGFLREQGRLDEAAACFARVIAIWENAKGKESAEVVDALVRLVDVLDTLGRYDEGAQLCRRAIAIGEKVLGPDHEATSLALNSLALILRAQGHDAEAEPLMRRSLAICQKTDGPESHKYGGRLYNLGMIVANQGRYSEADALYKQSLQVLEKALGPDSRYVADALGNLANLYMDLARYAESEALNQRALAIREKVLGPHHVEVALSLNNLGNIAVSQGRFADAEPYYRRALDIQKRAFGTEHPRVAASLSNLAVSYYNQSRYAEAEAIGLEALTIREKTLGPSHPVVGESLANLGNICADVRHYGMAEKLYKRALAIWDQHQGKDSPRSILILNNLALVYFDQARYNEAEPLFQRAIALCESKSAVDNFNLPSLLGNLALVYYQQARFAEALPLADRAVAIRERTMDSPSHRAGNYLWRGRVHWALGQKSTAVADVKRATELVEEQRGHASGGEFERATLFAGLAHSFEQMVSWQVELGDASEAFSAMERSRARALLDEMSIGGVDLSVARSTEERQRFRARENELNTRIAEIETQVVAAAAAQRKQLEGELSATRGALYDHYRDERITNPLYRDLLSVGAAIPQLDQLRDVLTKDGGLLLSYLLGSQGGYLLAVDAQGARLTRLEVTADQAQTLGCQSGPLTANRMSEVLMRADDSGIVQQLAAQSADPKLTERLKALWEVVLPADLREKITTDKYQRLAIIPDGALNLLPFEALVVDDVGPIKYLLDVGPPILCAPSATILYNLVEREAAPKKVTGSVLTVGDPAYPSASSLESARASSQGTARSRYGAAGGQLAQLPFSGIESRWVAKNLATLAGDLVSLFDARATERNFRDYVGGREFVHLACHGLTDQSFNNFFGALALAPGAAATTDATDDGFLSLPEIYALNLISCELAILSACQTNYGPQQKGEGVWALSRGFLVAGSRRVVASNWLVDDEAAASLVSYFTAGIAQQQRQGNPLSYAESLHAAKRWVRQQEKWRHPYYWGTFVLIGPN